MHITYKYVTWNPTMTLKVHMKVFKYLLIILTSFNINHKYYEPNIVENDPT